ncbi:MAG: hypothetical protein HY650_10645 [Acidobacteria bacterium]|nr:hypothetical protein [Acidobacteriota bacterium]
MSNKKTCEALITSGVAAHADMQCRYVITPKSFHNPAQGNTLGLDRPYSSIP